MTAPLAFVDTETTGLDPDRHEVWEVGLIVRGHPLSPNEDYESSWQLPVDLGRADPFALKVGEFHSRRQWSDLLTPVAVFAKDFAEATRGCHLVGAVVSFDEERLRKLLRANGACPEWHYHLVDVEALAVGYLMGRVAGGIASEGTPQLAAPPWKSEELSRAVGVDPDNFDRHTALGDARWARAIYDAVMGLA